ncbi:MAG: GNAT family N-acetyltransferase [Kiloniellaceae bacterium]
MTIRLETRRLVLRPLTDDDAEAVQDYAARWEIARMTTRIAHPYPEGAAAAWIAGQAAARDDGSEHTFAITPAQAPGPEARPIGVVSLRRVEPGNLELGYWLAPEHWGQGLATEAAQAMVVYGFEKLGAEALQSGHFADNLASGRVLEKAGFRANGIARQWSEARRGFVESRRFLLTRQSWQLARKASESAA